MEQKSLQEQINSFCSPFPHPSLPLSLHLFLPPSSFSSFLPIFPLYYLPFFLFLFSIFLEAVRCYENEHQQVSGHLVATLEGWPLLYFGPFIPIPYLRMQVCIGPIMVSNRRNKTDYILPIRLFCTESCRGSERPSPFFLRL